MKRGMLILLFTLLLACSVSAMTVELVSSTDSVDVNSKEVKCKVTKNETEELVSLTVYYENNESTTWQAGSTQNNPTSATEYPFSLTSLVNATYTWNCLAVNNESNAQYADANNTFKITFTTAAPPAENHAPELLIPLIDRIWPEDTVNISNLSYFFNDSDGDALTFSVVESPTGISVSISNDMVTFTPNANWTGNTSVMFSASDGQQATLSNPVSLNVTPVNDIPLASVIPDQNWTQNTNKTLDLGDYFFDVEDEDSALNFSYTFTSSDPININITIDSGGDAILTPETDWTGSETLTFTVYDTENAGVTSNEVTLTILASNVTTNNPPSIDTYSPESDPTISVGETQTFTITKSDPDGDSMNVTWYVDNVIQEEEISNTFKYTASEEGSFVIKVSVSDGQTSDSNSWALTVKSAGTGTNKTSPPPGDKELENETSACGDGVCSGDETTESCCKDCGCPEGWTCSSETNKCRREKGSGNIILLIIIISLFAGGAGVGLYLYKKKQEQEIFGLAKTPFQTPPKEEVKKEVVTPQQRPSIIKKPVEKPAKQPVKTTSQVLLKKYILYNLKKGKSFEEIKKELLKVGWTSDQIDDAYTTAKLDEVFS